MTSNIFDVIVGRGTLKWDAVWRVIAWLASPDEGHGLGTGFRDQLTAFCLGESLAPVDVLVEFHLGKDADGKTRHPDMVVAHPGISQPTRIALVDDVGSKSPNDKRKLDNLLRYAQLSSARFEGADRRIVAVTDSRDLERFSGLRNRFEEKHETLTMLPLPILAEWIDPSRCVDSPVVKDFRTWALSL